MVALQTYKKAAWPKGPPVAPDLLGSRHVVEGQCPSPNVACVALFHGSVTICSAIKLTGFLQAPTAENEECSRDLKTHRTTQKEALTIASSGMRHSVGRLCFKATKYSQSMGEGG